MQGKPQPTEPSGRGKGAFVAIMVLVAIGAALAAVITSPSNKQVKNLAFSEVIEQMNDDKVISARLHPQSMTVTGLLKDRTEFKSSYPPDYPITEQLDTAKVPFEVDNSKSSSNATWFILFGVIGFIALLYFFNRNRSTTAKASAGAPGRMIEAGEIPVSFRDVAGCDEVVKELQEIREFLADPERFRALGASIPKGVLLFGPPGTGKTLLARAVAGEANVPFFSISGSDFVEMYVGVGASRVRKLFEAAKQQAPCVVFIDEIDAVGRRRSGNAQGGQEERENTLNQLLVEIDGFAPTDNVIVMAASNRSDILDPALTRPGRFDRQIIVDAPDRNGRLAILKVHGKDKPFAKGVQLENIAGQTAGFSGADLSNLVNEAALLAARGGEKEITEKHLDEAIMRVIAGPQKSRLLSDKDKRTIAAHEIGHAIVANDVPESEPVHKVTIISRGRALGLMVSLQDGDKVLKTRSELLGDMAVALGGRLAEEIMFGEVTTGAENDFEQVNRIAQAMVLKYGMSDEFAMRALVDKDRLWVHSDDYSARIDSEVDAIVNEARLRAQEILLSRRDVLERLTEVLIERETIERGEFEALMRGEELPPMEVEQPSNVFYLHVSNSGASEATEQAPLEREPGAARDAQAATRHLVAVPDAPTEQEDPAPVAESEAA